MCRCCHCYGTPHRGYMHGRRFLTREEKIRELENYAEELKKELSAVEEKIKELTSK